MRYKYKFSLNIRNCNNYFIIPNVSDNQKLQKINNILSL